MLANVEEEKVSVRFTLQKTYNLSPLYLFIVTQEGLRNIPFWNSFVWNCLGTVTYSLSESHRQASIALSHSCRSPFLRASSPYQVISGTNVHNSSKYTAVIHAQLFQSPFNNSKSIIPCRWYCQCSLEYFHLYETRLRLATLLCREKKVPLTSTL